MTEIRFYFPDQTFGAFSNFAPYPILLNGTHWSTSEHYFQAQKFFDAAYRSRIQNAKTPAGAARLGRDRNQPLRSDWERVKVDVMRAALHAKFTQHATLLDLLMSTGDARIIEHTENDSYWGDGGDGCGCNMLGQLLMELRGALRRSMPSS